MITQRQLRALHRVVRSMNYIHGRISITTDDLLAEQEMLDLEERLSEALQVEPDVAIRIDF